ncbi:DUF2937 family protein [Pseudoponticoccus marisrubri]|uniref:Uncharacterized protein n=1 Tax=Pseudoponticoccus marisrubri TaxID=1685382 RepID=A0A0W7WNB6_9RHOB|nr:DUF2937 family protein [Pseudoponticoccus marisrubri]KUF12017.1 hypothetical protein AVJ23_05435 [Pseudoponticoccus marisrubri]
MILRALTLAGAVTGAAGLSQFPEFSQQYMQRLGGAVDELSRQVTRYERQAEELGMEMPAMLDALAEEGPLARQQSANMWSDIRRHERLQAALAALEGAGPFMRARLATHMGDRDIAERALEAYKPALPLTFEGAVFAGTGFFAGWAVLAGVFAFLRGGLQMAKQTVTRKRGVKNRRVPG